MKKKTNIIPISGIGNYYGGLSIKKEGNQYYWSIGDYNGDSWVEIPELLYSTLLNYEDSKQKYKNL